MTTTPSICRRGKRRRRPTASPMRVIARMGGTAVGLAMPDADVRAAARWVIAASAAAVLVAAGGVWAIVRASRAGAARRTARCSRIARSTSSSAA